MIHGVLLFFAFAISGCGPAVDEKVFGRWETIPQGGENLRITKKMLKLERVDMNSYLDAELTWDDKTHFTASVTAANGMYLPIMGGNRIIRGAILKLGTDTMEIQLAEDQILLQRNTWTTDQD